VIDNLLLETMAAMSETMAVVGDDAERVVGEDTEPVAA
jgi:hypothetical protein